MPSPNRIVLFLDPLTRQLIRDYAEVNGCTPSHAVDQIIQAAHINRNQIPLELPPPVTSVTPALPVSPARALGDAFADLFHAIAQEDLRTRPVSGRPPSPSKP